MDGHGEQGREVTDLSYGSFAKEDKLAVACPKRDCWLLRLWSCHGACCQGFVRDDALSLLMLMTCLD